MTREEEFELAEQARKAEGKLIRCQAHARYLRRTAARHNPGIRFEVILEDIIDERPHMQERRP